MGRTPPRARRRLTLAVVLLSFAYLVAFVGPAALAKPGGGNGGGHGQGQGHGGGGGNHGGGNAGGGGGNGNRGGGNGHGNGGGQGNGGGGNTVAAPTADAPAGDSVADGGNTGGGKSGKRGRSNGGGSGGGSSSGGSSGGGGAGQAAVQGTTQSSGSAGSQPSTSATPGTVTAASASPAARRRARQRATRRERASRTERAERRRARARRAATGGGDAAPARRGDTPGDRGAATPAALAAAVAPGQAAATGDSDGASDRYTSQASREDDSPVVVRTLRSVVEVIPGFVKAIIAALAIALMIASAAWFILARNTRFLRRQREKLLGEMGVLQGALLPNVPPELNRLDASVAYRPAEGLAAGGDFYDAFPLDRGRVGIVVGDVAGHGKEALMHTALLRYTMRAYLEAGLQPRVALQVAGRVLDRGFDTLATVVLAVYDPARNVLRYATAGHPPPVFLGEADHIPVTRASSPPIGAMMPTGLRQTTVCLPAGSAACFFTDGLIEARRDGTMIGRLGLVEIIRELGPRATAAELLDRVAAEADTVGDDMAACMFRVQDGPAAEDAPRVEELELLDRDPVAPLLEPFLTACGLAPETIERRVATAERTVAAAGGAIVSVTCLPHRPPHVEIDPANVESLAATQMARLAV